MISFLQRKIDNFQSTVLSISCLMVVCFFSIQSLQAQVTITTSTGTSPTAVCGQLFTVTIDATSGFTNLLSLQYNVGWDPAKADYISSAASLFSVDAPVVGTTNTSGGEIIYSWSSLGTPETLPNGTVLLTMTFRAITSSDMANFNIFGTATIPIEVYDNNLDPVPVLTLPATGLDIALTPLTVTIAPPAVIACSGAATGSLTATSTGTGPFNYEWSNGSVNGTNTGLVAGTYTVTVTGLYGCTGTASATITEPSAAVSFTSITINNPNCQAGVTGDVTALATGGTPGYSYLWSTGTAAAMASNLTAGTYLVTATDVNGCTAVCPTTARG